MIDLQTLLDAIDQLEPEDFEKVRQRIELHRTQLELGIKRGETPEERVAILQQAFTEMRAGLSDAELREVVEVMNQEYIEPEDEA